MNDTATHPMTLHQLAVYFQVSEKTMRKWILPLMPKLGHIYGNIYTPKQVRIIKEHLE